MVRSSVASRKRRKSPTTPRAARPSRDGGAAVDALLSMIPPRPHGKYERLAYERQERDLRAAYGARWNDETAYGDATLSAHPRGLYYDLEAGERVITFIQSFCRQHKGEWAGQPLVLQPWQRFCVLVTYGWMRADGTRRFRISYREVPRKNGKTEQAAAEGNYLHIADDEPGAEIYSTATKEDQAGIVWTAAKEMVKRSTELARWIKIRRKSLVCERTTGVMRPLGADSDTLDGLNPHGHICDEMHAHKKRGVWDVMITGMGARRQPLTIVITTAGIYDPESIGWELHEYAQQVLAGTVEDDAFFAIIFAADDGDDWKLPETWAKANPNLGVSVKLDFLREQCQRAEQQTNALNGFLRLHLNVWTQQISRWLDVEKFNACATIDAPLVRGSDWQLDRYHGRVAYLGLDLSSKLDITSVAIDIPEAGGEHTMAWLFWAPEELVRERALRNKRPDYSTWVRDGWLRTTPGSVIDYGFIRREINLLAKLVKIKQIGFDPWGATQFATELASDGYEMVEIRQGVASLSEPCKKFEALIVDGTLKHDGNPVMRWMVDNAVIRSDANGNIAPDKSSAAGKIDGVVASAMALSRSIRELPFKPSIYESRPVRSF